MSDGLKKRRYDENKLKELEQKGVPIDWAALDAPFNLGVTSITSAEVDTDVLTAANERIKHIVSSSGFTCELADILIFIVILHPDVPRAKDVVRWKRKDNAYVISKTIDLSDWQAASTRTRKTLLLAAVTEAISSIPTPRLSLPNKETLIEIVRQAINGKRRARSKAAREPNPLYE